MQRVFYFPLKTKLKALLQLDAYRSMLNHEFCRDKGDDIMGDVYDAAAWQNFMGKVCFPNNRIGE